jgi:diketogulonate reductase-like aldo/keto reductase
LSTPPPYLNEREVGEGIRRSGIARDDVFIETKIWISDYGYEATRHAFDKSARKLGVDQIDLLLLHQPLGSRFELTLDAYRALEQLLVDGKVRAIGVSNFMPAHLDRLLAVASVVPAVNQIEVHRTSSRPSCNGSRPSMASSLRRGRPSVGSPPTATPPRAPSTTRRCSTSPASTTSPRRK